MEEKNKHIKAMLPSEIALEIGVSVRTLYNMLEPLIKKGKLNRNKTKMYSPKQVSLIFDFLVVV